MAWRFDDTPFILHGGSYHWQFDRPKPALPNSYFWTWDHSTNWVLDDPGCQFNGCYNPYIKHPDTFVEDYRRLTDLAAGLGVKGIVVWGFLRDAHGGVEYAKRVADYAASRGVALMPGVGLTWYGGIYYEGDHPYNLGTFLQQHPDAHMVLDPKMHLDVRGQGACPAHPAYQDWLREALDWLYREFPIGGVNLENGDFLEDFHPLTQALRKDWPADDPEPYFFQGISYRQALETLCHQHADSLLTYATYTGFNLGAEAVQDTSMGKKPPAMLSLLPKQSICQWTLSGMVLGDPLPLTAYLDDGAPAAVFENPNWPARLLPPSTRCVGFVHQGSQWRGGRLQCVVSTIKEACLRASQAGLEGVSIHGEVSSRHIPWALNYLAFSHFIHWPQDTLRDFGRRTLGPVLGTEQDGEDFAEILAHWDAGALTPDLRKLADPCNHGFRSVPSGSSPATAADYQRYRFWAWLQAMANGECDRQGRQTFTV